ncbi:hypothetical protein EalM132_00062 [Exiguobacterium phage vB_EalM-132]|nr:hypothetical protein EalM132_00062 [Exiguobacterium phage vB_EalM-132]
MKLVVSHDGVEGTVHYDSLGKEVWVSHPDPKVRKVLNHFFTSKRDYSVSTQKPHPHVVGEDIKVSARAIDNHSFMLQGASELRAHTGIKVHWDNDTTIITKEV